MAVRAHFQLGDKSWLAGATYGLYALGTGCGNDPRPMLTLNPQQKTEI